jgi:hypothetical protein
LIIVSLRAYVNGAAVSVPTGGTALDAVRAADPSAADAVTRQDLVIMDSRGLPTDPATPVAMGSIFRLIPARLR